MTQNKPARVKSDTDSNKLAGFLAYIFEGGASDHVLDCIGPASVNQANKAVASARGILAPKGINIACSPTFFETKTESRTTQGEEDNKTGIRLTVFKY